MDRKRAFLGLSMGDKGGGPSPLGTLQELAHISPVEGFFFFLNEKPQRGLGL